MRSRRPMGVAAVMVMMGALALTNAARGPRFQLVHTVDVLQLLGAGMCFGVALVALFGRLTPSRRD
jgi:hypothetical protein